jgi:hypothetical protein
MVCQDVEMDPLEVVTPVFNARYYCEQLLVMCVIVVLRLDQFPRKEVDWPPLGLSVRFWAILA